MDSPLLASMRGPGAREGRSPGLASLKEAFDVANSVHRMEEEGARRRAYNGPGGAGPAGFLQGLNEDDEEAEEDEAVEEVRQKHGDAAASEVQQRKQQQTQQQVDKTRQQQQYQASNQGGYQPAGGADRKMAEAALYDGRAGSRDRGRSAGRGGRGGFELDMSTATLREFSSPPRFFTPALTDTPTDIRFSLLVCDSHPSRQASQEAESARQQRSRPSHERSLCTDGSRITNEALKSENPLVLPSTNTPHDTHLCPPLFARFDDPPQSASFPTTCVCTTSTTFFPPKDGLYKTVTRRMFFSPNTSPPL